MNRKRLYKILVFAVAFVVFSINAKAQYSSEEEMKDAANQFFEDENYIESLPLFSQLLSTYPKDLNYNYKYGASALFAKNDKEKPLKYLKFAVSKANVNPLAYYFLAKAQHLNYNFDAAIVYYNKFKEKGNAKDIKRFEVLRQIEMCQNGKKLLKSIVDIGVLDKTEIKETEFFRSYHLKGIEGKVTVKPDDFMSKLDKKKKENSLIYIGGKKDKIIFSSYGKSADSGRDLFSIERLPGGGWTEPTTLGLGINTKYDENYPFLHPDGKTLYFCSKGYNSMGGYDIFKSVYNKSTGTWSAPENLDFPINTPGDDVMYVSDADNKLAYFASSRASKQGKLIVYHVTVDHKSNIKSVIKGIFLSEANPSMKSATITIRDVEKDKRYAVYTTHEVTGDYMLMFPSNGGKFKILVETTADAPVHSAIIEIPKQDELRALKQELILVGTGDDEKLVVKNLFDESDEFDINDPLYVENVLKIKANLEVNTTEEEALNSSLQESLISAQTEQESPYTDLSDAELLAKTTEKGNLLKAQTTKSREQSNYAYQQANKKSGQAKTLFNEANNLSNDMETLTKKVEASQLINEAVALLNVARSLENEANERESDLTNITTIEAAINADLSSGNRSGAEDNAKKLDKIAAATYQTESALVADKSAAEALLEKKEETYHKDRREVTALVSRKNDINQTIVDLEGKKAATKKKKEIELYETQIAALRIDVEDIDFDLDRAKANEHKSKKEYDTAKNEVEISEKMVDDVMVNNSKAVQLDDNKKLRIENDINYLDNEGLVGLYAVSKNIPANNTEAYNFANDKEEYEIVNNEGELIDYNTQYGNELVDADAITDENEKRKKIIEVNEQWITSLDEEIEIREKQITASSNKNEQLNYKNRVEELTKLKFEKREEIAGLAIVVKENNTSNELNNNTEGTTGNEEEIVANENYEVAFTDELEQIGDEDTYEAYTQKAAIHTKWVAEINTEIGAKQKELVGASEEEKSTIENQLAILENDKLEQEEFAAIYQMQAESIPPAVSSENNNTTLVTNNNVTENTNVEKLNTDEIINENYKVAFTDELEQVSDEDTYEAYTQKAAIHTKWADQIDSDIAEKKYELSSANEEEKSAIENEIAILENDKLEQEEFISLYELQAESIAPVVVANHIITNKNSNEEENNSNIVNATAVDKATLTANNLDGAEDEFSNLKYNNKFAYKSAQSTGLLANVFALKQDAATMKKEADALISSTIEMDSQEEKDVAVLKSNQLNKQAEKKQEQIAKIYENANRNEFYNNDLIVSKLKKANTTIDEQNTAIAEMTMDESVVYYDQAKQFRADAVNATSFTIKESKLQKAYELEMKAIERQNKAIAIYTASGNEELLSIVTDEDNASLNERTTNAIETNEIALNNNTEVVSETSNTKNVTAVTPELETAKEINNTNDRVAEVTTVDAYEPLTISLPSLVIKAKANRLVKEAEVLNIEANHLADSASSIKKKKERKPVETQVEELKAEASRKLKEAEVLYVNAEGMKNEEEVLTQELSANRTAVAEERLTDNEKEEVNNLSAVEINTTINSNNYQDYAESKKETRRLVKEAQVEYITADLAQQEVDEQKTLGLSLNAMLAGAANEESKEKLEGKIAKLNAMIEENETKASDLRASATVKEQEALRQKEKSDYILINTSEKEAKNIVAIEKVGVYDTALFTKINNKTDEALASNEIVNNNETEDVEVNNTENENTNVEEPVNNTRENETVVNEVATNTNNPTADIDKIPVVLNQSIFKLNSNQAAYSSNKPIPTVSSLPEGLVFKVQIGAFRNPIPQNHFKGFSPIVKEDAGNGITRYTAGLFNGINMAIEAKKSIRSIGYSDAFVVAFFNGKRISIAEARAKLGDDSASENLAENTNNTTDNLAVNKIENANNNPINNNNTLSITAEVKDGISTDVRNINGVFFTIQVGVYSKPVANQLNNVNPLNSERTASGLIRYTSGVYKTLAAANVAKDRIKGLGISDAFIIAYNGGQKITVATANEILAENGNTMEETPIINVIEEEPINKDIEIEEEPEVVKEESFIDDTTPEEIIEEEPPAETIETKQDLKIEYKVQLGAYEEDVPVEDAGIFLRLIGRGVKNFEEEGKTVYTIGSFPNYNAALDLQIEMKELGVVNPKVLAFKDGVKIAVSEALELQKNNQ